MSIGSVSADAALDDAGPPKGAVETALDFATKATAEIQGAIAKAQAAIAGDDPDQAAQAKAQLPVLKRQIQDHDPAVVLDRIKTDLIAAGIAVDPAAVAVDVEKALSDACVAALADELTKDPSGFGYAGMADDAILSILNDNRLVPTGKTIPSPLELACLGAVPAGDTLAELFSDPTFGGAIKTVLSANADEFIRVKFDVAAPLIDPKDPSTIATANAAGEKAAIDTFRLPRPEIKEVRRRIYAVWRRNDVPFPHAPIAVTADLLAQARVLG